jgi:D-alanyl-D-alanine carboxypeptidase/D-alanyl-D-alanine-endopeptidase (penicillin-binding protein 4)
MSTMHHKLFYQAIIFFLLFGIVSCTTNRPLSRSAYQSLDQLIAESPVFSKSFTGFALYDPETKKFLYQQYADKYFTPASNTKIYTLYTALEVLGDSLPVLQYQRQGDSLVVWGTGNPMFLSDLFPEFREGYNFLSDQSGTLYLCFDNYHDRVYGSGWAWDDYPYAYQTHKSAFPIYSNLVRFAHDSLSGKMQVYPRFFERYLQLDETLPEARPITTRDFSGNAFRYNMNADTNRVVDRFMPFDYTPSLAAALLGDTLGRLVQLGCVEPTQKQTLNIPMPDTLLRRLMYESDNFVAEQLLLMAAGNVLDTLETRKIIAYAKDSLFADSPDALAWYDGSGLSRYNLFTPRTTVFVLEKLFQALPQERLFDLFATGKQEGTIRNWYGPYIHAKTGTIRNKHCLSGYLVGNSGKVYIFSFMHNQYLGSSSPLKVEMEKVLRLLRDDL